MRAVSMDTLARTGIALAGALSVNASLEAADDLKSHRWNHRLLLIFSPGSDDRRLRAVDEQLETQTCEVIERGLVVGRLPRRK